MLLREHFKQSVSMYLGRETCLGCAIIHTADILMEPNNNSPVDAKKYISQALAGRKQSKAFCGNQ